MKSNSAEQIIPVDSGSALIESLKLALDRVQELEAENEQLKLVASYAKDVTDFWPSMTFRTIRIMIPKMESLKQALKIADK